jgi:acetaldehyde dehydrogenase (acetylating)
MIAARTISAVGGFVLTFITAFMVVSNYNSYQHPEEIMVFRDAIDIAMEDQQKVSGPTDTEEAYNSLAENVDVYLTEYRYKQSSLFKGIGAFIALLGSVFLRRRLRIGAHLVLGGMLFSIIGTFYFHSIGFTGWLLAAAPLTFTLAVGAVIYRKRASLT